MALDAKMVRRLLSGAPTTTDAAEALKEWRRRDGLSQAEAAIKLGVSVRTLQGWELGRPMPYPILLSRAVDTISQPRERYSLTQSEFPREFAEFIDFVGATSLDKAIRKVDHKLSTLSRSSRSLFGDRYFFHEQCIRFSEGPTPFQLDIMNPIAVRSGSLIAAINRVKRSLSPRAATRLRAMVLDNLRPDRDVRQIEHEFRCSTHFNRKGCHVQFADLEGLGNFDLLVTAPSEIIQVECKTVTEDTGSQIKSDLTANLSETFRSAADNQIAVDAPGIFILTFRKPTAQCKNISRQLNEILKSQNPKSASLDDFSIEFFPRPQWGESMNSQQALSLQQQIILDPEVKEYARCFTKSGNKVLGLVLRPHKPAALGERIIEVIKEGADQCPRDRGSLVWLHFVGFAEAQFIAAAEFSMEGKGAGLNAIVANALHPLASSTDRTHIKLIRFSADGTNLSHHPALAPDLSFARAVSNGGFIYEVPNSYSRFSKSTAEEF